ncbi:MAG: hypothetical protein HY650_02905 [Acidobacteria bacterium]|nr:hypothetical protein [Acidobacteriota bacterium]
MLRERHDRSWRLNTTLVAIVLCVVLNPMGAAARHAPVRQNYNLRAGTEVLTVLVADLDARMIREGEVFSLRLTQPVGIEGREVLPRGAEIHGHVEAWQDQDGNYSILVLKFESLRIGMASHPIGVRVKGLEVGMPDEPSLQRTDDRLPEMSRRPSGDPRDGPIPQGDPYPPTDDRDPRTGERRRPTMGPGGGVSMRRLPANDDVGKPSAIGLRRENVANMKVSAGEDGESHISIDQVDIAIRSGTRFRLILIRDLSLQR